MIIDLPVRPGLRILVTARPVDFRRGMDSLSMLVKETLATDPYAGDVFVFRAKRADRLKILVWDGSGLVLLSKRLERGRFTWPAVQDGAVRLSAVQLSLLFSGLDWSQVVPRTPLSHNSRPDGAIAGVRIEPRLGNLLACLSIRRRCRAIPID